MHGQTAERSQAGTGHIAARAAFNAINSGGRYAHLVSGAPGPLPGSERQYTARDYVTVLSRLGYTFALNELDDHIEVNGEPLSDVQEAVIRTQLRDQGLNYTNRARDAYIAEAARNAYHPVKRYLGSLLWDGQDSIAALARYVRDRHGVFPLYLRRWAVGAVAKVYEQAQNPMLVLDGSQGLGKSRLARWFASPLPGYFVESSIDPNDKDHHIRLARNWIWEVGELGSTTRKADREALKYLLTMGWVTVRKPYDRHDMVKPALASFIGTVNNESGFLNDPTGSRRFMVCSLEEIDWDYTSLDVNQIWAQACALYQAGKPWQLTPDEATQASEINAEYEMENPLEDLLRLHFEMDPAHVDWKLTSVAILDHLHTCTVWHLNNLTHEARNSHRRSRSCASRRLGSRIPKHGCG